MIRRIATLIFTLVIAQSLFSQEIHVGVQVGIGSYAMSDFKEFNNGMVKELDILYGIETEVVSNFPDQLYYRPLFLIGFTEYLHVGFSLSQMTTSSKIKAIDNANDYRLDMTVSSKTPGVYASFVKPIAGNLQFKLNSIVGFSNTDVTIEEYLTDGNEQLINRKNLYRARNYYIEPGVSLAYRYKIITFELNSGYYFNFTGDVRSDVKHPVNGNILRPGWDGYRVGATLILSLDVSESPQ